MAKVTSQPSPSSEVPAPAPALPAPALPSPALLLRALRLHPALPRSCAARRAGTALPACPGPGDGRGEAVHCFSRQHARRQVIVLQFIWYNNHSHVLVPGAGTDPCCRAAAWSMMPSPVSGDARDPPPQGAGRGWQPSPPHCTPGAGSSHLHRPHAHAALLLPWVILVSAWNRGLAVQRSLLGNSRGTRLRGHSS